MNYQEIVRFHGHQCPGLAIGFRMATAAMDKLGSLHARDEELAAIVENNACGVDALQCVTGCTFGKGNLLFHDYGKQVYTIYSRSTLSGVRVVFHGKGIPAEIRRDREAMTHWILTAPEENILTVTEVSVPEPEPASVRKSVPCSCCGESVMETRLRQLNDTLVCIPCLNKNSP